MQLLVFFRAPAELPLEKVSQVAASFERLAGPMLQRDIRRVLCLRRPSSETPRRRWVVRSGPARVHSDQAIEKFIPPLLCCSHQLGAETGPSQDNRRTLMKSPAGKLCDGSGMMWTSVLPRGDF